MAIRSSIVIVDAEEYGRTGVTEFNDFGVAVSFGIVVVDLCVVEGDDDLYKTIFLAERLVLDFLFFLLLFVIVCIVYFLVVIFTVFDGFITFLLVWTF